MGWGRQFILLLLLIPALAGAEDVTCEYEDQVSGLKKATCRFPVCPDTQDCKPPEIDVKSAKIEYKTPWARLRKPCTAPMQGDDPLKMPASCKEIRGACWEIKKKFKFTMSAQDASPIDLIGPAMALDIGPDKRIFARYMQTPKKLGSIYQMEDEIHVCVPLAGKLDITVQQLCARDNNFNEGCALPLFSLNEPEIIPRGFAEPSTR